MPFLPSLPRARRARILIVQDRERSADYELKQFERAAKQAGIEIDVDIYDMTPPIDAVVDAIAKQGIWYDWMITDLLRDEIEGDALTSTGFRLIQAIVARGLFGRYSPRSGSSIGVRCIAIYSVRVDHGYVPAPDLRKALGDLGIREDAIVHGGDISKFVRKVCSELAQDLGYEAV